MIAIDRAREFISEMTSAPPTQQIESSTVIKIVALIGILGFLFVTLGTVILQEIKSQGPPIPLFFAIFGFSALVLICRYLVKLISPTVKSENRRTILPAQAEQKNIPLPIRENRTLNEQSYSQQSVVEEPTQQFEDERRVR